MDLNFFKNKRVLITGHTGFKGSWLTEILLLAGAEVYGLSLEPETDPALFDLLNLRERLGERSMIGDVRNLAAVERAFSTAKPEIVFHLAAQPIVRTSYEEPVRTYETNVLGTVHVLECVRQSGTVRSLVNVTTDKVYENLETGRPYVETDRLEGYDPYSNSKSCSELVTHSYQNAFLKDLGVAVSTARAGNVIGGGDYSKDRLLPDGVRAAKAGQPLILRNPESVRPYQHVLEPLFAYLLIAKAQYEDPSLAGAYNVGPDAQDCLRTREMADLFCKAWGEGQTFLAGPAGGPHEAGLLRLDNTKLKTVFGWHPVWDAKTAIEKTVAWEKAADKPAETVREIRAFAALFEGSAHV